MGDQLAGAIGAFLAAGVAPADAAALGLFYGGRAADLAELDTALSPMDVSRLLPRAFRSPGRRNAPFRMPFVSFDQPPRR
jgi:NAD(P)H-hydrate repair Nnr-like enzyme with NAD(P)H-hydrate dehydratase domain